MGRIGQRRPDNTADRHAELKSSVYQFAHRGLVGLFLWIFRRNIDDALARYFSIAAAIVAWFCALALLALANRHGFELPGHIAVYAVIGIPLLALVEWVSRQHRDALAAEHGRDSEAYNAALEAGHQDAARTAMEDDWVLDPPWKRPELKQKPRFGRQAR